LVSDGLGEATTLDSDRQVVKCRAIAPDGKVLATRGEERRVKVWEGSYGSILLPSEGFN
jgi:hypothetical protein